MIFMVDFDGDRIKQVFNNLLNNSIKYNDKAIGTVEIDYRKEKKEHLFSFKDNGVGIDKKHHEQIHENHFMNNLCCLRWIRFNKINYSFSNHVAFNFLRIHFIF